jgi:hypothetical protein
MFYLSIYSLVRAFYLFVSFISGVCSSHRVLPTLPISLLILTPSLIDADYCVAAILISYSGVLGRLSPIQYLTMAFLETMLYSGLGLFLHLFIGRDRVLYI